MGERLFYSLLITMGAVFGWLYIMNFIFGMIFGEFGLYVSMFATIIFTIVYCTLSIISKLNKNIEKQD